MKLEPAAVRCKGGRHSAHAHLAYAVQFFSGNDSRETVAYTRCVVESPFTPRVKHPQNVKPTADVSEFIEGRVARGESASATEAVSECV